MSEESKNNRTDQLAQSAGEAFKFALLQMARSNIDDVKFDVNDMPDLFNSLRSESTTGAILIFSSYLEDRVQQLIALRLRDVKSNEERSSVFGLNGPLHGFAAQITLAYQLRWISSDTRALIRAWRKIRNEFAHRGHNARLDSEVLQAHYALLKAPAEQQVKFMEEQDKQRPDQAPPDYLEEMRRYARRAPLPRTEQHWLLMSLILLAHTVLEEILINSVAGDYIADAYNALGLGAAQPGAVKALWQNAAKSISTVLR